MRIIHTHRIAHKVLKTHFKWGPVNNKGQQQGFGRLVLDQSITTFMNHSHFRLAYTHQIMHLNRLSKIYSKPKRQCNPLLVFFLGLKTA